MPKPKPVYLERYNRYWEVTSRKGFFIMCTTGGQVETRPYEQEVF